MGGLLRRLGIDLRLDEGESLSARRWSIPIVFCRTAQPGKLAGATGFTTDAGSQGTTIIPPVTEDFATRLLPRGRVAQLLTVREVAAQLRVCTATVYRLCTEGQLRHVRVLHAIRVHPLDLAAFVRARRRRRQ